MDLESFNTQFSQYPEAAKCGGVRLLGIRGYQQNVAGDRNRMGIYDDVIIRCIGEEITVWPASTDPGQYYIDHPVNPHGCAQLQCGLWWYQIGEHLGAHLALVQAEPVRVSRLDHEGVKTGEESGWFGINIHSGGPEYLVGKWSAGCQVIHPEDCAWGKKWNEFFNPILASLHAGVQKRVPYLLVESLKAD